MEFRCRLASPNGEIVEGVYIAETESRLRHELEEKGLFVLSLQPKHAIAGVSLHMPQRKAISTREFLVFNQELATLLKAGMPLVQSLDLLKRRAEGTAVPRVPHDMHERGPGTPEGPRRCARESPVGHGAVGCIRVARRPVSARLSRVAACRRTERQS